MKVHIDSIGFKRKPEKAEIGGIKSRLTNPATIKDCTIQEIAQALTQGRTVQPGVTPFSEESRKKGRKGTSMEDFQMQTLFMNDVDNKLPDVPKVTPADVAELLRRHDLHPAFAYDTFNSTPEHERFRIALVSDEPFTDRAQRDAVQAALIALIPQSDAECINADRIFFGTDKGLIEGAGDLTAVCTKDALLALVDAMGITVQNGKKKEIPRFGETIPTGARHGALVSFASSVLKKYGISDAAYQAYRERAAQCDEPLPDSETDTIWWDACRYYKNTICKTPGYVAPAEYAVQEFAEQPGEPVKPDKQKKPRKDAVSYHTSIARRYMRDHHYVVGVQRLCKGGYGNEVIYEYSGGVWKPRSEGDVKSAFTKELLSMGTMPDPKEINKAYQLVIMGGRRKDVATFNPDEDLVCFRNGVYRLSDGAALDHSPEYYFTVQLNASIPEKIGATPYCDLCLANYGGAEKQFLLMQIFGAAISNVHIPRFKKAFLQYGKGDAGKTQIKGLAQRILGQGNYNNVDLSDLENNRFMKAAFQGVRLGGSNDMSNVKVSELKVFKQLTGGDTIQAENKGEHSFTFKFNGLLWLLANQLPLFGGDKGEHVYNRWIVYPCPNAVPPEKQIKDLEDRMFAERDSFCMKALQALQKAIADNYKFAIPEECRLANEQYRRENSSVRTFITEYCEPLTPEACTADQTTGKLWAAFKEWCRDSNAYLPTKTEFRREVAQIAGVDVQDVDSYHNRHGNFYPYVLTKQGRKELNLSFL